jgi:hypothetical protein
LSSDDLRQPYDTKMFSFNIQPVVHIVNDIQSANFVQAIDVMTPTVAITANNINIATSTDSSIDQTNQFVTAFQSLVNQQVDTETFANQFSSLINQYQHKIVNDSLQVENIYGQNINHLLDNLTHHDSGQDNHNSHLNLDQLLPSHPSESQASVSHTTPPPAIHITPAHLDGGALHELSHHVNLTQHMHGH